MNNRKVYKLMCIIMAIMLCLSGCSFKNNTKGVVQKSSQETEKKYAASDVKSILKQTAEYYKQNKKRPGSWWEVAALSTYEPDTFKKDFTLPEWKSDELSGDSQAAKYAGFILGFLAEGENPSNVWGGRNLLLELKNIQNDKGSFGAINDNAWSIIALEAAKGDYNREKAVSYIMSQQKNDGGFAYGEDNSPEAESDPDMTGMVLIALSKFKGNKDADASVSKALNFLNKAQLNTGGFNSYGQDNLNSTASVISGLTAAGENVMSDKWTKNGYTMLDALMRFQLKDGSFSYTLDSKKTNDMATYQAFIALQDIGKGMSLWSLFKSTAVNNETKIQTEDSASNTEVQAEKQNKQESKSVPQAQKNTADVQESATITVGVKIIGFNNNVYYDGNVTLPEKGANALLALKGTGLAYKALDEGSYVTEIAGEKEFQHGQFSGWKYKVNGSVPNEPAADSSIKNGDQVLWWYALSASSTGPGE